MNTISKIIAMLGAILILLGVSVIGTTETQEPSTEPIQPTEIEQAIIADSVSVAYDKVAVGTEKYKAPKVTSSPEQWVYDVLASHGVTVSVPITVSSGCRGAYTLGCTSYLPEITGPRVTGIRISPSVIGTAQGVHTVLHEAGHAKGIMTECGADAFAHAHGADPSFHDFYC